MANIIIKGEVHGGPRDIKEEKNLLNGEVDAVVFERSSGFQLSGNLLDIWLLLCLEFTLWLVHGRVVGLKDHHKELEQIASDARIYTTRQNDLEIIHSIQPLIRAVIALTSAGVIVVPLIVWSEVLVNDLRVALVYALLVIFIPLATTLGIREYESKWTNDGKNRNEKMANQLMELFRKHQQIVLIVGSDHAKRVYELLPEKTNKKLIYAKDRSARSLLKISFIIRFIVAITIIYFLSQFALTILY